ncbi:MAG: bifunctional 3-deoxy-7-phosphoheptulonate synthase/chorismate mutase type II [Bacteroidales bacterium]|nr:bifunctional 3-deoxy-7-phosphoheptulonate synthase/chorismate mutase type II [Bacteroidales bacterium]
MNNTLIINNKPIIIAGPCSAENENQLRTTIEQIAKDDRVSMIRCGVWKPRTRPGGFEGVGEPALRWIETIKQNFPSVPFCCEVARPEHIELCLQYGIDAVWIGARTTVNPFLVSELAEALKGSELAVMVKNPITPDVELWIGAIERIQQSGISNIAAVHRGFSTYNNFGYRNNPLWEIPIELKRRLPMMPLLCDPSHIGGRRSLVAPISQMALDLHFDGLIIECHPDPANALTDSQQQITPNELINLLDGLKKRTYDEPAPTDLNRLREQLDVIDAEILRLLSQRMQLSKDIGDIKHEYNMPIFQPQRWQQVLERQMAAARTMGLDEQFIKEITEKIHGESLRMQEQ